MAITWLKLHNDILGDIKLRRFTPQEKWAWVVILILANQSRDRGYISADDEDIADACEFNTPQDWLYYRDKLIAKGMLEHSEKGLKVLNWEARQRISPSDKVDATKDQSGFIYLIQAVGTSRHKIGLTIDIDRRMSQLSRQSVFPLRLVDTQPSEDMVSDELFWHQKFANHRVHGEWFDLSDEQVLEFKNAAKTEGEDV